MGEIVGVYYNKKKLADLGLKVPTTWSEFTAQLATIKKSGETPLMLGDLEKWPAIHVFGPIQGAHTPAAEIMDLGLGNPGGDWTDATNTAAATELASWVKDGYFNADINGSKYDDIVAKFGAGTGVFLMAGSWNTATLDPVMGDNLGFFAPPPRSPVTRPRPRAARPSPSRSRARRSTPTRPRPTSTSSRATTR